jgi:hypothetical protein
MPDPSATPVRLDGPPGPTRRYLTMYELSASSGLSMSTLRRLCRRGRLPFFQPGGPRTRIVFSQDAIEQASVAADHPSAAAVESTGPVNNARRHGPAPKWMSGPCKR